MNNLRNGLLQCKLISLHGLNQSSDNFCAGSKGGPIRETTVQQSSQAERMSANLWSTVCPY